jgi:hypothetical protein
MHGNKVLTFSDSRDFGPGGPKERAVLCAECRAYYKKYGELPANNSANNNANNNNNSGGGSGRETPYLFRPVQTESPDGSPGRMRTRNKAKETVTTLLLLLHRKIKTK